MRSYFVLQPAKPVQAFTPAPSVLLTQPDLWVAGRQSGTSLVFRVRSDNAAGSAFDLGTDKFESCVGLIDEAVRWRMAFGAVRTALNIIQHDQLKAVCMGAAQMITSQHPAAVPAAARQAILNDVQKIVFDTPQGIKKPHAIDAALAIGVASVAQCESGYEAAAYVPFWQALCPFEEGTAEYRDRMTTIDVVASSSLLAEACARLTERMPQWLFYDVSQIATSTPAVAPAPREEDDD